MKIILKNLPQLALSILLLFAACSESEDVLDDTDNREIQVISNADLGYILVNQKNETLYFFASDVNGESTCNGGCANAWPPLLGEVADLELGASLEADDFGTVARGDGQKQITYKGWPLYYFSPNGDGVLETSAAINGDGANGVFYIAKPDYTVMLGKKVIVEDEDPIVYLVDDRGITLYDFLNDEENDSNCAGGCATAWPPLNTSTMVVPSSLNAENFEIIEREDDLGDQLTFNGRPLYYFVTDDNIRGNTLGQGGGGGNFFVVQPIQ